MDHQKIFDQVLTHLVTQGKPAAYEDGSCAYRTADNLMCAVGCLIPDHLYNTEMEGHGVRKLLAAHPALTDYLQVSVGNGDWQLLADLQSLHDRYGRMGSTFTWPTFATAARVIAKVYSLKINVSIPK